LSMIVGLADGWMDGCGGDRQRWAMCGDGRGEITGSLLAYG